MPLLPETLETDRLLLRVPRPEDADALFARYASDPEVTRYVGFPRHRAVADARAFIAFDDEQRRAGQGTAYLLFRRDNGALLGSTGLALEGERRAMTGYVLARDAWGVGFASEALEAMVTLAFGGAGVERLFALCHPSHAASERVLAKARFTKEGILRRYQVFPNLDPDALQDAAIWARVIGD